MMVIVGLGNPGKDFQKTRHNIGFRVVNKLKGIFEFSNWKENKKLLAKISKGKISGKTVILAKPQTFMNESGKAVKLLSTLYKLKNENIWIVHDDLDIPLGKMKISKKRGAAGHKGVQSIINEIGTKNFVRFRIGIKPKIQKRESKALDKFVLKKFNKDEEKIIKEVIEKTAEAIGVAIKKGAEKAMSKYNK